MSAGTGLPEPPVPLSGDGPSVPAGGWAPHDIPSAAQLLDAVREFLESEVVAVTEGRMRFHVRVAANVLRTVGREIVLGPEQAAAHARRLAGLGVDSDAELAAAIRSGALDARWEEVRAVVGATVRDKLAVANPGYLGAEGDAEDRSPRP